jgi:polyisoprenoid-binding protein YceI
MGSVRATRFAAALLALASFAPTAPAAAEQPAAFHYRLQAKSSQLAWELPATLHTVHGRAPGLSGTIDAVAGPNGEWTVHARIVVEAAAMVTGNEKRDRNMREKVLETDRFPEIVFEARRVRADLSRFRVGERFTVEASGDLTVHGRALPIQLPVDVSVSADRVTLQGSFPLAWKSYGLNDPSFGVVTVREPMRVVFRLEAVEAPARP